MIYKSKDFKSTEYILTAKMEEKNLQKEVMQSSTWKPEIHVYSTGKQVCVWIQIQENGTKFTDLSREGE